MELGIYYLFIYLGHGESGEEESGLEWEGYIIFRECKFCKTTSMVHWKAEHAWVDMGSMKPG